MTITATNSAVIPTGEAIAAYNDSLSTPPGDALGWWRLYDALYRYINSAELSCNPATQSRGSIRAAQPVFHAHTRCYRTACDLDPRLRGQTIEKGYAYLSGACVDLDAER